ncbi:hypothetical protein FUA25_12380 [Chryseobacterium sp.]|nr:hypothetical protein FUA25_12380 [Chryseobacterium sp.]
MELHLKVIGILFMVLALIHVGFPQYFKWKQDLKPLSLINRQMMEIHTFFIALTVFLMGLLCLTSYEELMTTSLGKTVCFGLGIFWALRLIFQLIIYSPKLWRGKAFETIMHFVFTVFWVYLSVIFFRISLS